jgi:hypothetical protein
MGSDLFHNIRNNTFQYLFAEQGAAVTLKLDNQFAHFANNIHRYLYSLKGAALSAYSFDIPRSGIRLTNNLYENIFNIYSGAVTISSQYTDAMQLIVNNCTFRSLSAMDGSAIYVSELATVFVG